MKAWKTLPGNSLYLVSDHGDVRSLSPMNRFGEEMRPFKSGGYFCVKLTLPSGKQRAHKVHRLVALAFLGDPPPGRDEVAHNDGNPANNHVSNLRWASHAENIADQKAHGTWPSGEKNGNARLSAQQVEEIRRLRASGKKLREIAPIYGVTMAAISLACRGKTWAPPGSAPGLRPGSAGLAE